MRHDINRAENHQVVGHERLIDAVNGPLVLFGISGILNGRRFQFLHAGLVVQRNELSGQPARLVRRDQSLHRRLDGLHPSGFILLPERRQVRHDHFINRHRS